MTYRTRPHTGPDAAAVLDEALAALGPHRSLDWLGDTGVTLHLLASLHRQIHARLPDAVADARDQDYTRAQIANLLDTTRAAAWNRYGRPDRKGNPRPTTD
jgi:hypothetical protein